VEVVGFFWGFRGVGGQLGLLLVWVTMVGWVFLGYSFFFFLFFFFLISFLWIVVHRVERGKSDIENIIDLFLLLALHCIHVLSLIFFFFFSRMYKVFLILWVLDLLERNFVLFLCLSDYMGFRFSKPKYSTMFFELCGVSLNDFMHFPGLQV